MVKARQVAQSLGHVYWLGGATTAGKSTISKRLATDFGMIRYDFDAQRSEHISRVTEDQHPALYSRAKQGQGGFRELLLKSPEEIAAAATDVYRERLSMVVEDLLAIGGGSPIVADVYFGRTLDTIGQIAYPGRVVFLVPTLEFHRLEYQRRFRENWKPFFRQALEHCPDPEQAFMAGWAQYQIDYNQYLREECRMRDLPVLITGGKHTVDESYAAVCDQFGLSG
jgi:hypothetical protein